MGQWQQCRGGTRVVHPMLHVEYLSYVCSAIHALHARLLASGVRYPAGTLAWWLQTVYDRGLE